MPMKSYDDGVIVHMDHAAGDEVALGQRVMVLAKKGEDPKQVAAAWARRPGRHGPWQAAATAGSSTPAALRQWPAGARGWRRRRHELGPAAARPARWHARWPSRPTWI